MSPQNELVLYGTVGSCFWDEAFFTAAQVVEQLAPMSGPVTVRLNSGGGIAHEGLAIYSALADYAAQKGAVEVVVDGMAASAASLIAMAGSRITLRLGSTLMIHDPAQPFTEGRGTEADHLRLARALNVLSGAYADVYAKRAQISREEARAIMRDETFMDGPMAIALGFATDYDPETAAAAAAMFDYRMYKNAPPALRAASDCLGAKAPSTAAVVAMMAGFPRRPPEKKETTMAPLASLDPAADDAVDTPETAAPETAPAPDTAQAVTAAVAGERTRAARIHQTAMAAGYDPALTHKLIAEPVSLEAAIDQITAHWKGKGDVDTPMPGRSTATILRDERDTMRAGMAAALEAQMRRGAPADDRGREYMTSSLVEMAATTIGYKGSLRTAADRLDVVTMAMHSVSDLPSILENALNKRLGASYALAQPTYRRIAREMSFADFRPHPISRMSDYPMLQPVGEGGEIKFGTISDKKESVVIAPYASALTLSRQMMVNDDLGAIDRMVANSGLTVAAFEDATFWAMALGGAGGNGPTMLETTRQMFNTTEGTLAAANAAITVASLSIGRAALRKRKRLDGTDLDVSAAILLVGPDKETEAQQIVAPIQAQQSGNVNPFSGTLSVVTTAKITGNAWYLFADPSLLENFVYGYLDGAAGPRFRIDQPFGRQGTSFSVELDFGCGASDWRGGWKNIGA